MQAPTTAYVPWYGELTECLCLFVCLSLSVCLSVSVCLSLCPSVLQLQPDLVSEMAEDAMAKHEDNPMVREKFDLESVYMYVYMYM